MIRRNDARSANRSGRRPALAGLFLIAALALAGCGEGEQKSGETSPPADKPAADQVVEKPPAPPPDRLVLTAVRFQDLPGWAEDNQAHALIAQRRSCERLAKLEQDRPVGPDGVGGRVSDWLEPCRALGDVAADDDAAARRYFETWFTPYAASNNGTRQGMFTGYYEVELAGSTEPGPDYPAVLYKRPDDLVMVELGDFSDRWKGERTAGRVVNGRLKPYDDRAAIEAGALSGRGLELVWLKDPIAAFFLHIQGSGRVRLADGREMRVGYAGQNGHRYVAIGRPLIDRGAISREEVSLQTIRAWLQNNPGEAAAVMSLNPSYIFFQELQDDGPVGAQGVVLTAGRSLAVDAKFMPYGAPVWLDVQDPLKPEQRIRRLMVAQDTGGAIRGPVRGDFFWGHGADAEERAGKMKSSGEYHLLLPKTVTVAETNQLSPSDS